ncbi:hypothetical protein EZY14_009040 [Kordia sp. TARA_039_SRF]|nr:hypothetical protein EZY14_009040 [Kordia sp. TARA_039_SRF]
MQPEQYRKQDSAVSGHSYQPSALQLQYPVINSNDFKQTVDNYLLHVAKYNNSLPKINKPIEEYNNLVSEINKNQQVNQQDVDTEIKQFRSWSKFFYGAGIINDKVYNDLVEQYNRESDIKVPKKELQPLKQPAKDVFVAILSHCVGKLKSRNLDRMNARETTAINPAEGFLFPLTCRSLKKQSVQQDNFKATKLNYCDKTILNHTKRLMDADIISSYKYHGYKIAKEMALNPLILQMSEGSNDAHKQWTQSTLKKKLPITISSYRNLNKEKDNKANIAKANSLSKEELEGVQHIRQLLNRNTSNSASSDSDESSYRNFYRNNRKQVSTQNEPGAEKKRKKVAPKKEKLTIRSSFQKLLDMDLYNAAHDLAAGIYDDYHPLPSQHIHEEAVKGVLDKSQFRKIMLFDFIFTAARLWIGRNVYVGEWINTLKYLERTFFIDSSRGIYSKSFQEDFMQQLRWRLDWARRYCQRNPEFKLLYPSMYFDISRKKSFEGGFAYTKKHYDRNEREKVRYQEKKKRRSYEAKNKEITQKIRLKIREFLKDKITFERLVDYVRRLEYRNQKQKHSLVNCLNNMLIVERENLKHAKKH